MPFCQISIENSHRQLDVTTLSWRPFALSDQLRSPARATRESSFPLNFLIFPTSLMKSVAFGQRKVMGKTKVLFRYL